MLGSSLVAAQLAASQGGLSSMEFVWLVVWLGGFSVVAYCTEDSVWYPLHPSRHTRVFYDSYCLGRELAWPWKWNYLPRTRSAVLTGDWKTSAESHFPTSQATFFRPWGSAVAQAVSCWLPTAVARVRVRPHVGFVEDKVALVQVFSEYFGFPCQSFHQFLHHHNHLGLAQ
jgi:hypothetical protein